MLNLPLALAHRRRVRMLDRVVVHVLLGATIRYGRRSKAAEVFPVGLSLGCFCEGRSRRAPGIQDLDSRC